MIVSVKRGDRDFIWIKPPADMPETMFTRFQTLSRKNNLFVAVDTVSHCHAYRGSIHQINKILEDLEYNGFTAEIDEVIKQEIIKKFDKIQFSKQLAEKAIERVEKYSGKTVRNYQREDIAWMHSVDSGVNALQQRLGKSLEAAACFRQKGNIVICPKAAVSVWVSQIKLWRKDLKPIVVMKKKDFRWPKSFEVIILHYQALPKEYDSDKGIPGMASLKAECPSNIMIVYDECQWIKNPGIDLTRRAKALCWAIQDRAGFAWLVTGTPLPNRRAELWSFLQFLRLGSKLFGSERAFVKADPSQDAEIARILSTVMVRRLRSEVFTEVPKVTRTTTPVPIDGPLKGILDTIWQKAIDRGLLEDPDEFLTVLKMDPEFQLYSTIRSALAKAKVPAALEWAEAMEMEEEPAVIVSAHKYPCEALGSRPGWAYIHGGVDQKVRDQHIADFQARKLKGIALTAKTAGVAIDLSRSGSLLMLDRGWVPGDNAQAEDRIVEAGKTDPLLYTDLLIDHPLEEHLLYVLLLKQEQIVRIDQVSNQCNDPNRSIKSTEHAMALISGNAEFEHDIDLSPLEG